MEWPGGVHEKDWHIRVDCPTFPGTIKGLRARLIWTDNDEVPFILPIDLCRTAKSDAKTCLKCIEAFTEHFYHEPDWIPPELVDPRTLEEWSEPQQNNVQKDT